MAKQCPQGCKHTLGQPPASAAAVDELAALGNLMISHVQSRVGERCCGATATAYRKRR